MDFTIKAYLKLISSLENAGFAFQTFAEFIESPQANSVILRHDVDKLPYNSLVFAKIQADRGIHGTYYFRAVPGSYNEAVIKEIASMGHEVGYHYETMDTCRGNIDKAYDEFCKNFEKFRRITDIRTISMHGSPLSKHDNRDIWRKYDYKKLGIIAEPYFDLAFNMVFYLTDTGRCWDGSKYNVRDKATKENPVTNPEFLKLQYHSTQDVIHAIREGSFSSKSHVKLPPSALASFAAVLASGAYLAKP